MNFRTYNLTLLTPLGCLFAIFIALGVWVEPLTGDLTRLGGFTENAFGWNEPQQRFSSRLFDYDGGKEYGRYYDVVVLGDSFSHTSPRAQWQNYLVRETGWSLVTYQIDKIDIESFVASAAYKDHPPRIVIYQTVERAFVDRGNTWDKGDCQTSPSSRKPPITPQAGHQPLSEFTRDTRNGPLHPNLSSGVHYLKRLIKKTLRKKSNQAIKLALSRSDLFSNQQSGSILIYRNDFGRYGVSREDLDSAICGLSHIQNVFQQNGETFFIGMISPDKLTAYMDVYQNFDREKINWTDEIAKHPNLNVPRLDRALRQAIARGTRDVYLPNDTHWGSNGYQIVARTLVQYLTREKSFPQP